VAVAELPVDELVLAVLLLAAMAGAW